jgi:hypothetical protein
MMTGIAPRGILASQFWIDAKAYVQAAETLINSSTQNINQPVYFMLSHALELTLKAYLLARGADEADLIKIGHNLKDAHEEAAKRGLKVKGEHTVALIERLSEFHNAFIFRYPILTKDERRLVVRGHLVKATEVLEIVASICTQVHGTALFARIDAADAGEFWVETWHMGFPAEGEPDPEKPNE